MKNISVLCALSAFFLFTSCDAFEDDLCDTALDTAMIRVSGTSLGYDYMIDVFEASRSNASLETQGTGVTDACSYKNTIPWTNVTFQDAMDACENAGKRLCTRDEWQAACVLGGEFPYGDSYNVSTCNASGSVAASGSHVACKTPTGVYDLSGNVSELVTVGKDEYSIMGGSYNSKENDLVCVGSSAKYSVLKFNPQPSVGFRCCKDVF